MDKEDYAKYYIQGSDHYLLPKDVFIELFDEIEQLEQQLKKKEEVIEKAIDFITHGDLLYLACKNTVVYDYNLEIKAVADRLEELLQILEDKEVE